MKSNSCPICNNHDLIHELRVVVSPWIRRLGIQKKTSKYFYCQDCSLGFFNYRYSPKEISLIYNLYRGENYLKNRNKWEPWYNKDFNATHDRQSYIISKKKYLETFLLGNLKSKPQTLVDYGGDKGQYIPNLGQEKSYVLDVSNNDTLPGIKRISSLNEVITPDLVILSHVLEHVSNPLAMLENLLEQSKVVYVEVPFGCPQPDKQKESNTKFLITLLSSFNPRLWSGKTQASTGRKSLNRTLVQAEHINFFTNETFNVIGRYLSASIICVVSSVPTPDGMEAKVIQCLITRKQSQTLG
jgi:hypothetical protein